MNISGIGSYSSSYNSIRIDQLFGKHKPQEAAQVSSQSNAAAIDPSELHAIRDKQTLSSADYAKTYEADKTYDLKGADSDIASLDHTKDASGSQKSQIMQQYQMFMGETQAQGVRQFAMNTRAVRAVENFAF